MFSIDATITEAIVWIGSSRASTLLIQPRFQVQSFTFPDRGAGWREPANQRITVCIIPCMSQFAASPCCTRLSSSWHLHFSLDNNCSNSLKVILCWRQRAAAVQLVSLKSCPAASKVNLNILIHNKPIKMPSGFSHQPQQISCCAALCGDLKPQRNEGRLVSLFLRYLTPGGAGHEA